MNRALLAFLFCAFAAAFATAQSTLGLRRLSHAQVIALVEGNTVLFAAQGAVVHEYHGEFVDGVAPTAFRDWDQTVMGGRLELRADQAPLVCYHYPDDYGNCAFFVVDETTGRTYLDFVTTVQQQTVEVLSGDRMNLQDRIQLPYREPSE